MTSGLWRGIEGRVLEVVASGDDPGERARALIDILRGADEDWTWDEDYDRGWARRADGFGPAVDAQVDIGSPAVEALLEAETPGDSWYATLAVLALKGLVEEGHAVHRLPEVLEWCQRNSGGPWKRTSRRESSLWGWWRLLERHPPQVWTRWGP